MKSRTSFFNLTAFRKNITRFAPVWALYSVFLLLILFGIGGQEPMYMARDVLQVIRLAGWGNMIYAGIVAMCLFGDLYKGRLCNALHAFPMRREGWLLTNISSGFLFSVIPNLVICAITSLLLGEYALYIWILFAISILQYLFFFGTAVLSAVCAGNRLGMVAVYSIIQFIVVLIYFLAEVIYQPLIYGIELQTDGFYQFFPLSRMAAEYVKTDYETKVLKFVGFDTAQCIHLALCALVGIICFVFAWLVYRRRHLERAGDFVALKPVGPVFLVIYTVAVGAVLYTLLDLFGSPTYLFYAVGIVIGWFTGQMLLNRTVRVFHKKSWLAFGVLVVVLSGSMALTWLDPTGIGRYVPPAEKVSTVAIYGPDKHYFYFEYDSECFEFSDPEEITKAQSLHKKLANNRPAGSNTYDVRIRYKLTDGTEVKRYYRVDLSNDALLEETKVWFSDARYIFQLDDPQMLYSLFSGFTVDKYTYDDKNWAPYFFESKDPETLKGLLDAILADCAAGNMGQAWCLHDGKVSDYGISFELKDATLQESYEMLRFKSVSIYEDCTNTLAYLEKFLDEQAENENP